ncbi:uncharacterized protein [Paramisgurnus dabryanus]|uniref:uncharacterized protein isoform X1 n=2 Tax=Paramisgurnus dabryanus TaxID=90735 RepID=UPI003CCFA48F
MTSSQSERSVRRTMEEFTYVWSKEQTVEFIQLRSRHEHLFTGKRNAAKYGWETVIQKMGLEGKVSVQQASRKWENMKKKYKELKYPPTGSGRENGEETATSWPWYNAMDEAIGQKASITPPIIMSSLLSNEDLTISSPTFFTSPPPMASLTGPSPMASLTGPSPVASVAGPSPVASVAGPSPVASVAGPSPVASVAGPSPVASVAGPSPVASVAGPSPVASVASLSPMTSVAGPSPMTSVAGPSIRSSIPPTRRKKRVATEILDFLREESAKEEEREKQFTDFNERFLTLFESFLKK